MKTYAPPYYSEFKCISSRCKHNCCIGWEIDIDEYSLKYYQSLDGEMGNRLRDNIKLDGVPHFILSIGERCPFLNKDGLCDLILELGEKGLCQICTDHPRYKNYYDTRLEIGLGLCCEAACELILNYTGDLSLVVLAEDDKSTLDNPIELEFLYKRDELIKLLSNNDKPITFKIQQIIEDNNINFENTSSSYWYEVLFSLERLDAEWDRYLSRFKNTQFDITKIDLSMYDNIARNLLYYFSLRHLSDSIYYNDFISRITFSIMSTYIILALSQGSKDIYEVARMYSSEIEYSDENLSQIIDIFK